MKYVERKNGKNKVITKKDEDSEISSKSSKLNETKEGRLTAEERKNIWYIISQQGTVSVMHDAYVFFEAVGSEIASFLMGRNYIHPLNIVHELKEYIVNVNLDVHPSDSLRKMPVVSVVKVLATRL